MVHPMADTDKPTVQPPLSLKELGEVLVEHYGYHAGLWDVAIEFQLAVGRIGPVPDNSLPGAMLGVSRIGLAPAQQVGPATIDASKVNPKDQV